MRFKIILILTLLFFSFVNNLIMHFDSLQEITKEQDLEVFYQMADPTLENEGYLKKYVETISQYVVYFVFFYNTDNLYSIVEAHNY